MADVEEKEQQPGTSTEDEEEELKQMANKIRHYRTTLPNKLKQTLALLLAAQRPIDPSQSAADPNPNPVENDGKSSEGTLLAEEDPQTAEKIRLLKQKMHSNVSAMPALKERVTDCLSRINKQETYDTVDTNIHPAFKRKRTQ